MPQTHSSTSHSTYHVGQRISFESNLCTVRYIGEVEGTKKEWLGVEWDDPSRGKHDGSHKGKRYFQCQSPSPTAASFLRTTRLSDREQSFVEAIQEKYAAPLAAQSTRPNEQIEISGKIVEEVGFDKIRQQQARLHELKIVLVDGMGIKEAQIPGMDIRQICPKIVELDLSRNLFEKFEQISDIVAELQHLRKLRLNGNRLQDLGDNSLLAKKVIVRAHASREITDLELDNMLLSWDAVRAIAAQFPLLSTLSASSNFFKSLSCPVPNGITSLILEYNDFTTVQDIINLRKMTSLEVLYLKGNKISNICRDGYQLSSFPSFSRRLKYVDLSYNAINSWSFVDDLPHVFLGLEELRLSHNPIYESLSKENGIITSVEEGYMLTLARLGNLKSLNFSKITAADRTNAEVFYLSRIAKAMAEVAETEEHTVTSQHRRYPELCKKYGAPAVVRKREGAVNPDFLEARLIKFIFYLLSKSQGHEEVITKLRDIPKSFDVYRVKGIVGKMFDISPLKIRLIWETGEWDPVAGYEDNEGDSEDDEDDPRVKGTETNGATIEGKGSWMKREVEIEDGTRQVGFCVDGLKATVRIEMR